MIDPILEARLDALEGHLRNVHPSETLRDRLADADVDDEVWAGLDATLGTGARAQLLEVRKVRGLLEKAENETREESSERRDRIGEAWRLYGDIYQESQDIFSEFLEFVGGLAFRERGLDERICRVADALVRACSKETIGDLWQSVTVPSRQEAVTKGLARIIRLRFPERTIWTLPLAAHEFGHVVVEENKGLADFVQEQIKPSSPSAAILRKEAAQEERAAQRAELHLTELIADAFATYYMGPAYGWASIHLRLNPLTEDDQEHPSDHKRVHVILAVLDRLNQQAGGAQPYKDILSQLTERWERMHEQAGATAQMNDDEKGTLDELVQAVWDVFQVYLLADSPYPDTGEHGWLVAQRWQGRWTKEIRANQLPTVPGDVIRTSKLRDALNAAWWFRILNPEQSETVTAEALKLCEDIIRLEKPPAVVQVAERTR